MWWKPKMCELCKMRPAVWKPLLGVAAATVDSLSQGDATYCDGCSHSLFLPRNARGDYVRWQGCELMDLMETIDEMRRVTSP